MEKILTLMCPITYSPGNLRSMLDRGKRVQNKTKLMQIIERNTNISGEDTIDTSRRCDRFVAEDIINKYKDLGSRGKDLALPPNYEQDGPFDFEVIGNKCKVYNKFDKMEAVVVVPRCAKLWIDLAWSQTRAVLRQRNGDFRKSMAEIFADSSAVKGKEGVVNKNKRGLSKPEIPPPSHEDLHTTPPAAPRSWASSPSFEEFEQGTQEMESLDSDLFDEGEGRKGVDGKLF